MRTHTIKIGDREWQLDALPINSVEKLAEIIDEDAPTTLAGMVNRCSRLLAVGLNYLDPSMTMENIRAIKATFVELDAAAGVVLEAAGFKPGEESPVASSVNGSALSKPPLLPAADTGHESLTD